MKFFGNFTGAFADGALLFPLLVALTLQVGMDAKMLLASTGVAYIAAGLVFRVPMAVQPLKSVVVAALALGAGAGEIAISGFAVGVACLILSCCYADRIATLIPKHLVHGLQMALGLMLMIKGAQWGFEDQSPFMAVSFFVLAACILIVSWRINKPVMGWVAAVSLFAGLMLTFRQENTISVVVPTENLMRVDIILALVLPQLALTLTNSVVGTQDVVQRYFGEKATRVTARNLLRSIGIGNIIVAPLGGLPFCHGAGGITAHVKGGAHSWHMNLVIGGVLLMLALLSWALKMPIIPAYPKIFMAALLFATGWFHIGLARPSWQQTDLRLVMVIMGVTALLSLNMLWVLTMGIVCETIRHLSDLKQAKVKS